MRFSGTTERAIEAEARRLKRSKSAIVEALAEEAMKTRRFPGIAFRGDDAGRRPHVIGTGLDVWELIELLQNYGSAEAVVTDFPLVDHRHMRLAQRYYAEYAEEIEEAIADNRRPLDELLELYPFIQSPLAR